MSPKGPQDVEKCRILAQDSWVAYEKNDLSKPRPTLKKKKKNKKNHLIP